MQSRSEDAKGQGDQIIRQFIQGFVDSRKKEFKLIKETNLLCRQLIETRISETPDVNRLLLKYQDDPWIKKILVSYTLLQMYHDASLWDVDDSLEGRKCYIKELFYSVQRCL